MSDLNDPCRQTGEAPELPWDLGDEVLYRGKRWMVDDEALIGLEGQGYLLWGEFDPEDLVPVKE
jgi:hypothetical protein